MNFILRIVVTAIVAFGLSYVLSSGIHIDKFTTALILALVLAVLNAFLKPLLIILTLPITILTFGLFLFVINAGIIMLASKFVDGFKVDGFWWALLFSLLLSTLTSLLYKKEGEKESRNN
ncbi:MAG TPA: phage holin family protein [Puia sp.]|nr:phage holin family protein [Puia sp.]